MKKYRLILVEIGCSTIELCIEAATEQEIDDKTLYLITNTFQRLKIIQIGG